MNYPARGKMSDDGKYFTHTDGSVYERRTSNDTAWDMVKCAACKYSGRGCTAEAQDGCRWIKVANAYVPTDEEREACDMARKQIEKCRRQFRHGECYMCSEMLPKTCPARVYLAKHNQADAWEVK